MFKHVLVPLDGSRLAEAALPVAAHLAEKLNSSVTLLHVIERKAPEEIHGQRHLTEPSDARAYLNEVRDRAFPASLHVEQHVHTSEVGDVAQSIVEHIGELKPDLITMCTHGRGGVRDLLFGNIAQQVVALGTMPVVLVRPGDDRIPTHFSCRLLLVPLDGTPSHEVGLHVATDLARACKAELHLVVVVPTIGDLLGERAAAQRLLPGTTAAMLEISQQACEQYLRRHVDQLKGLGLAATGEVARGDPAPVIATTAQRVHASLIVLGTHGKIGMDALWSGSVAPRIVSHTCIPLLLVPLPA